MGKQEEEMTPVLVDPERPIAVVDMHHYSLLSDVILFSSLEPSPVALATEGLLLTSVYFLWVALVEASFLENTRCAWTFYRILGCDPPAQSMWRRHYDD